MRTPTPWERLDGMKHGLDSILEQAVQWEQERIVKLLIEETGHNGKTHYLGMHCSLCNLIEKIEENDDAV